MRHLIIAALLGGCAAKQPPVVVAPCPDAPLSRVACNRHDVNIHCGEWDGVLYCWCAHPDGSAHAVTPPPEAVEHFLQRHIGEENL